MHGDSLLTNICSHKGHFSFNLPSLLCHCRTRFTSPTLLRPTKPHPVISHFTFQCYYSESDCTTFPLLLFIITFLSFPCVSMHSFTFSYSASITKHLHATLSWTVFFQSLSKHISLSPQSSHHSISSSDLQLISFLWLVYTQKGTWIEDSPPFLHASHPDISTSFAWVLFPLLRIVSTLSRPARDCNLVFLISSYCDTPKITSRHPMIKAWRCFKWSARGTQVLLTYSRHVNFVIQKSVRSDTSHGDIQAVQNTIDTHQSKVHRSTHTTKAMTSKRVIRIERNTAGACWMGVSRVRTVTRMVQVRVISGCSSLQSLMLR